MKAGDDSRFENMIANVNAQVVSDLRRVHHDAKPGEPLPASLTSRPIDEEPPAVARK